MLWFAPRKAGTGWSKVNKTRFERLIASGLMTPAGLSKVEAAKQDGSWNVLDRIETLEIPSYLDKALSANKVAQQDFIAFPRSVGTTLEISNLRREFKRVLKNAGVPKIRFHDLRHSAASIMLSHKIPVVIVSKILGHSKPSVTMDIFITISSPHRMMKP